MASGIGRSPFTGDRGTREGLTPALLFGIGRSAGADVLAAAFFGEQQPPGSISGGASQDATPSLAAAGRLAITGATAQDATPTQTASGDGSQVITGSANQDATPTQNASGTLGISGSASQDATPSLAAAGRLPLGGASTQDATPAQLAIGALEEGIAAGAVLDATPQQSASGALAILGTAIQDVSPLLVASGRFGALGLPMEAAFIALMLSDAMIAAIVADRVYPVSRPQGSLLPAITSTRISGAPLYADEGEVGLEQARLQVDCWAASYGAAKMLARAVTARLSGFEGVFAGKDFHDISLDLEQDLREGGANAAQYLFRTSLDFLVLVER